MNQAKPTTFADIESIWYEGYRENRNQHYHNSRYHFLNLHSFFHGHHTVELRGFNGTLHAGKIRAYIVLALALNHQALTQKSARYQKVQEENERFAMRTYLNRIGFIGDEFKNCREHLYQHLSGNAAWRYGSRRTCAATSETEDTMNKDRLYIAYGSNLNLEQMKHRCPTAEVVGAAELRNWRLWFREETTAPSLLLSVSGGLRCRCSSGGFSRG